jgi:DNA-binding NtrC family response regulator
MKPRILLVDDDDAVRELCVEVLDFAGYEVVAAWRGEDALARLLAGERFAALVTDQSMAGLSGDALIAQAGVLAPGMPCLLMTGHGESVRTAIDVPVLRKPFRTAQLAAIVAELVAP